MNLAYVHPIPLTMHWKYRIYQLFSGNKIPWPWPSFRKLCISGFKKHIGYLFASHRWIKRKWIACWKMSISTAVLRNHNKTIQTSKITTHYNKQTKCTAVYHLLCISNNACGQLYFQHHHKRHIRAKHVPLHSETLRKFTTQLKNSLRCQRHYSEIR